MLSPQGGESQSATGLYLQHRSRPPASSPAYRRSRVTGDAEPPGL